MSQYCPSRSSSFRVARSPLAVLLVAAACSAPADSAPDFGTPPFTGPLGAAPGAAGVASAPPPASGVGGAGAGVAAPTNEGNPDPSAPVAVSPAAGGAPAVSGAAPAAGGAAPASGGAAGAAPAAGGAAGAAPAAGGSANAAAAGSAGLPASGGAAPVPGAGGTVAAGGAAPVGSPVDIPLPEPPGDAFFFDDFEGGAPGTQPAAWEHFISYITTASNEPTDTEFALLDDSQSFRGAQSVHFHVERPSAPAMLRMALPAGISQVNVRAFVMSSITVGGVPRDSVSNHETLIGLRAAGSGGDDEIRFGGAKGALGFNAVGPGRNDAVAPTMDLWSSPPGLQAGQWHCVEIAFSNAGTPRATATLDGTVVRDVTSPQGWHIPVSNQWLDGLLEEVMIGWQSFSPAPANDVWMDDVVLSESPIGCN